MIRKTVYMVAILLFSATFTHAGTTLTKDKPLSLDLDKGTVSFLAEVNGKYLYQGTRHFAVYEDGKNGDKSVFKGFVNHLDFYDALMKIKAEPGNNMTLENKEKTHVTGTGFDVAVSWEGADRVYTIDEVIVESNKNPIAMKFGGNYENAKKLDTGCLLCLDSCPVGVVSNSTYTYGAVSKRKEVSFKGNQEILPPDGTPVTITLTAK